MFNAAPDSNPRPLTANRALPVIAEESVAGSLTVIIVLVGSRVISEFGDTTAPSSVKCV